jgi:GNAT superfamily N-acetyltransferase
MPAHFLQSIYAAVMWRLQNWIGLRLAKVRVGEFKSLLETTRSKNPEIAIRLLDPRGVLTLCADPASGLDVDHASWRLAQGQFFIGSFAGETLVGYDWYAPGPLCLERGAVYFVFDPSFICCAYSFVQPAYRGRGLGADRWDFAHRVFAARGWRGTLYYIETRNFSSLRAAAKRTDAAQRWVGTFVHIRLIGRWICWTSPGCRRLGISVTTRIPPNSFWERPIEMPERERPRPLGRS